MLYSMTGFGTSESTINGKQIVVEIKSLNGKQFDVVTKLPPILRSYELEIRNLLNNTLLRGTIDLSISVKQEGASKPMTVNTGLAIFYYQSMKQIAEKLNIPQDNILATLMRMPEVVAPEQDVLPDEEWQVVKKVLQEAAQQLMQHRKHEGMALYNDMHKRIGNIETLLEKILPLEGQRTEKIRITQAQIEHKIGVLNYQKAQKDELLNSQVQQSEVLKKETDEANQVVQELKGKENELVQNIEKNKKAAKRLERAISEIIAREIEQARKKAEEEARKRAAEEKTAAARTGTVTGAKVTAPSTTVPAPAAPKNAAPSYSLSLTPEVSALSSNFQANKGSLPWPVDKGFIAEPFGVHHHAVAEKVVVENQGIEIQTSPGATARAIFDGIVTSVSYIPGMGQLVIILHGEFFTAYSRLENVGVKKGEKVHIKQQLGNVMLNDDNVPMMHFELWRVGSNNKASPVDPANWIAPMR